MSPLSTVLPPPDIETLVHYYGPSMENFATEGNNQNVSSLINVTRRFPAGQTIGPSVRNHGGSGVEQVAHNRGGRPNVRIRTGAVSTGAAWGITPQEWVPGWQAAAADAALASGSRQLPTGVVGVFDFHISTSVGTVFPGAAVADVTGIGFFCKTPTDGLTNLSLYMPPAGNATGGFAAFPAADGAGDLVWQYVSWNNGVVLERVTVPGLDTREWNTWRWIITSASPGSAASLELQVNGDVIVQRDFDDILLMTPRGINANAMGYMPGYEVGGGWGALGVGGIHVAWDWWLGRFTPAGVEVQGV